MKKSEQSHLNLEMMKDGVKLGGWFWMTKKSYRSPDTDGRTHEKPGGLLWMSRDDAASS